MEENHVVDFVPETIDSAIDTVLKPVSKAITIPPTELVPDSIGEESKHSPFAKVLIDILDNNEDVLPANNLYSMIINDLAKISKGQSPVYGEFDYSIHQQNGDFLFVPTIYK